MSLTLNRSTAAEEHPHLTKTPINGSIMKYLPFLFIISGGFSKEIRSFKKNTYLSHSKPRKRSFLPRPSLDDHHPRRLLSNSASPPLIYDSAASLMCERATQYLILLRICRCFLEFKATRITQQHSIITLSCVIVLSITIRCEEDEGINQGEFLIDVTTSSAPWW